MQGSLVKIDVGWRDEDKRVLLYTFPEQWLWVDFFQCKEIADAMLDAVDEHNRSIILLFDMRASGPLPSNSFEIARNVFRTAHPRGRPLIGVVENQTITMMVNMVRRFLPERERERLMLFTSMATADAFINRLLANEDPLA
jgi:hypothetical protein